MSTENKDLAEVIVETAKADAERIVRAAEEYGEKTVADAKEKAVAYEAEADEKIAAEVEDVKRRRRANARMDAKKQTLAAKTGLVGEVYDKALSMLFEMTEEEYTAYCEKLIEKYAEKGDTVYVSEKPFDITGKVAASKAVKDLSLSVKSGDFDGGIVISGKTYDRDLSFSSAVNAVREETETATAERLFGDNG